MPDSFGERAATEEEIDDWVELVRAGQRAARAFKAVPGRADSMRPTYGSGQASHEGEE